MLSCEIITAFGGPVVPTRRRRIKQRLGCEKTKQRGKGGTRCMRHSGEVIDEVVSGCNGSDCAYLVFHSVAIVSVRRLEVECVRVLSST